MGTNEDVKWFYLLFTVLFLSLILLSHLAFITLCSCVPRVLHLFPLGWFSDFISDPRASGVPSIGCLTNTLLELCKQTWLNPDWKNWDWFCSGISNLGFRKEFSLFYVGLKVLSTVDSGQKLSEWASHAGQPRSAQSSLVLDFMQIKSNTKSFLFKIQSNAILAMHCMWSISEMASDPRPVDKLFFSFQSCLLHSSMKCWSRLRYLQNLGTAMTCDESFNHLQPFYC